MAPCFDSFSLPGRVKEVGLRPLANSGENKPPLVVTGPEREKERERERERERDDDDDDDDDGCRDTMGMWYQGLQEGCKLISHHCLCW